MALLRDSDSKSESDSFYDFSEFTRALLDDSDDQDDVDVLRELLAFGYEPQRQRCAFSPLHGPFDDYADEEFKMLFRLNKTTVYSLLEDIQSELETEEQSVSPILQLLVTLRYYATGAPFHVMADLAGIAVSIVQICIKNVSKVIALKSKEIIRMPVGNEKEDVTWMFQQIANFPKVVGALGTTHVKILSTGVELEPQFRNKMGFYSLKVQAVCGPDKSFRSIHARWPGGARDNDIFCMSSLRPRFEDGDMRECVLLGDNAYKMKRYLMTPVVKPTLPVEVLYNTSLRRTRLVLDKSCDVWKDRFPVLSVGLQLSMEEIMAVTVATAVLHNIALGEHDDIPQMDSNVLKQMDDQHLDTRCLNHAGRRNFIFNHFQNVYDKSV